LLAGAACAFLRQANPRERQKMSTHKLQVFDSRAMPWEERFIPELGKALFAKRFLEDPETGVTVRLVKYPSQ